MWGVEGGWLFPPIAVLHEQQQQSKQQPTAGRGRAWGRQQSSSQSGWGHRSGTAGGGSQGEAAGGSGSSDGGDAGCARIVRVEGAAGVESHWYSVPMPECAVLRISEQHYQKLRQLHRGGGAAEERDGSGDGVGAASGHGRGDGWHAEGESGHDHRKGEGGGLRAQGQREAELEQQLLLRRMFCCVSRYETLSGKSSGMQGALSTTIFDTLHSQLRVTTECFASPLNCYLRRYVAEHAVVLWSMLSR